MATKSTKTMILGHLGALITVALWGASFVNTKVLLDNHLTPAQIYIIRFAIAYLIIVCINHKRFLSYRWIDELLFAVGGMCAGSIYFLAENTALEYTLTTNVALLTSTSPLFTAMLAGLLYKSERLSKGAWLGSCVAFLGVACVIFNSSFNVNIKPLGDLLSLGASISWAIYSLILRRLNAEYDGWYITRKTFFYGLVTALPFLWFEKSSPDFWHIIVKPEVVLNVLFLSILCSLVGYVMWARIVKKVGAVKANNYIYLQPVFTLIVSALYINERVTLVGYIGIVLILGGLWLGDRLNQKWR